MDDNKTTTDDDRTGTPGDGGSVDHTQPVRVPAFAEGEPTVRAWRTAQKWCASVSLYSPVAESSFQLTAFGATEKEARQAAISRWNQAFGSGLASEIARLREALTVAARRFDTIAESLAAHVGVFDIEFYALKGRNAVQEALESPAALTPQTPQDAPRQAAKYAHAASALTPSPSADPTDHE